MEYEKNIASTNLLKDSLSIMRRPVGQLGALFKQGWKFLMILTNTEGRNIVAKSDSNSKFHRLCQFFWFQIFSLDSNKLLDFRGTMIRNITKVKFLIAKIMT